MTEKHQPVDEEAAGETGIDSTDSSTLTVTTSSFSGDSVSTDTTVGTDEPNQKEIVVDQTGHGGSPEVESLEHLGLSPQEADRQVRRKHDDSVDFDREQENKVGGSPEVESLEHPELLQQEADRQVRRQHDDSVDFDRKQELNGGANGAPEYGGKNQPETQNGSPEKEEIRTKDSPEESYDVIHQSESKTHVSRDADVREQELYAGVVEDYDLKNVLRKQETYHLYCPNCRHRITRTVVLKRRKLKIHRKLRDSKREKPDICVAESTDESETASDRAEVGGGDRDLDGKPGEGFKSNSASEENQQIETPVISQQTHTKAKKSWFPSIFGRKETAVEQDDQKVDTESSDSSKVVDNKRETVKDQKKSLTPPDAVSPSEKQSQPQIKKDTDGTKPSGPSSEGCVLPIHPSSGTEAVNKETDTSQEVRKETKLPPEGASPQLKEPADSFATELDSEPTNVTVVAYPVKPKPESPGRVPPINIPTKPNSLQQDNGQTQKEETQSVEAGQGGKLEILKSIVYGGLIESITSLGVVSSAAGSGASPLNILVVGLANLFGGLVLIVHNLLELISEKPRRIATDDDQTNEKEEEEEEDRYKRLLGRRENFRIHMFVVILSFVIFGLIPPVVYGFSFRKTDKRRYKAAAVLAASLICVILLAIGKAHVKRPRESYFRTAFYYTKIAIGASGISYIVSDFANELLEKYGFYDDVAQARRG